MVKNPPANAGDADVGPGSGRSPGEGDGNPLIFLPGKSPGQRRLAGHSQWGHKELDKTELSTQCTDLLGGRKMPNSLQS